MEQVRDAIMQDSFTEFAEEFYAKWRDFDQKDEFNKVAAAKQEFNNLTIDSLSTALEGKLNKDISLGTLVELGLMDTTTMLTAARQAKIEALYNNGKAESERKTWKDITFSEFFAIVFNVLDAM